MDKRWVVHILLETGIHTCFNIALTCPYDFFRNTVCTQRWFAPLCHHSLVLFYPDSLVPSCSCSLNSHILVPLCSFALGTLAALYSCILALWHRCALIPICNFSCLLHLLVSLTLTTACACLYPLAAHNPNTPSTQMGGILNHCSCMLLTLILLALFMLLILRDGGNTSFNTVMCSHTVMLNGGGDTLYSELVAPLWSCILDLAPSCPFISACTPCIHLYPLMIVTLVLACVHSWPSLLLMPTCTCSCPL